MTPILWGRASSINVQKVMWALAECDVPHERIDAGWTYGQTDTPEFRAMAPLGKVPAWQDGDVILWESHVILRHVARGPCAALWPKALHDKARADLWMEFTTTTLLPPLIGIFIQTVRTAPDKRSADIVDIHVSALNTALDVLEDQLTKTPWLVGDDLSLGDIAAGTTMFRYFDMDIPRRDRPVISDWYERMRERPAYQGSAMNSYEELRAV